LISCVQPDAATAVQVVATPEAVATGRCVVECMPWCFPSKTVQPPAPSTGEPLVLPIHLWLLVQMQLLVLLPPEAAVDDARVAAKADPLDYYYPELFHYPESFRTSDDRSQYRVIFLTQGHTSPRYARLFDRMHLVSRPLPQSSVHHPTSAMVDCHACHVMDTYSFMDPSGFDCDAIYSGHQTQAFKCFESNATDASCFCLVSWSFKSSFSCFSLNNTRSTTR